MEVLRHLHDEYQPGALIYREISVLSATFTDNAAASTWTDIDNGGGDILEISYTPPVGVLCLINFSIVAKHSVADKDYRFRVYDGSDAVLSFRGMSNGNGTEETRAGSIGYSMTGSTAYTLTGQFYFADAGTLTVWEYPSHTYLEILAFRKP